MRERPLRDTTIRALAAGERLRLCCRSASQEDACLQQFFETNYQDGISNKYDAIKAAVGHMVLQGLSAGTIASRTRILCRYVARDLSIIDSFDALRLSQLMRGIRWSHGRTGTRRVKPLLSLRTLMRVLYPERRRGGRQGQRSLMLRTLWYLAIATGNRICHVRGARGVRTQPDGVAILWGPRKVMVNPPNDYVFYAYAWSAPPPEDILLYLREHGIPHIGKEKNMASSLNAWLQRSTGNVHRERGAPAMTSGTARVRMANVLGRLSEARQISDVEYQILMDHDIKQGRHTYRRLGDPDDGIDDVEV